MRAGEAEGDPEGDRRRTLVNGWESRLWRLEDKNLREGSSARQFGRPRPLRIRHRRRRSKIRIARCECSLLKNSVKSVPVTGKFFQFVHYDIQLKYPDHMT